MKTKYPGKLYLIGEYNVVASGHSAIVMAVDKFMHFEIESDSIFNITDNNLCIQSYDFKEFKDIDNMDIMLTFINDYFNYINKTLKPFKLIIKNELRDNDIKYGFGSSATIVVGFIDTILKFYNIKITKEQLFKLSVLLQLKVNHLSSGGDIASAIYGNVIYYQRYDIDWLNKQDKSFELLNIKWPLLEIEYVPFNYQVIVGWSNSPYQSSKAVKAFKQFQMTNPKEYHLWITKAQKCVLETKDSLINNQDIKSYIDQYVLLLHQLQSYLHQPIETDILRQLRIIANGYGYGSKLSGAGGGDCGIVLTNKKDNVVHLLNDWQKNGILHIDTKVWVNDEK